MQLYPPSGYEARVLLGWLALRPGLHARSDVASVFWPEADGEMARTNLDAAVRSLRQSLGPHAEQCLVSDRESVGLADGVWVDALTFNEMVIAGKLEEAVEMSRGDLLQGIDEDWVQDAREEYRMRLEGALDQLATGAKPG